MEPLGFDSRAAELNAARSPLPAGSLAAGLLAFVLVLGAGTSRAASDPFAVLEIPSTGRTLAAEIVDLDGDGRDDVLQLTSSGIPPEEIRTARVFLNGPDGVPSTPTFEVPLPDGAAGYDVADILPSPGVELLLLRARGVTVMSLARMDDAEPRLVDLDLGGARTLAGAEDERGLDRIGLVSRAFGDEPWLVVPGLGEAFLVTAAGEVRARIEVGGRANYFMQPPGPIMAESDIQIYFDAARTSVGDVDGDGLADIVAATRHELRVFLQKEDGFAPLPDRKFPLRRVSDEDHIRGSGSVRTTAEDIDGDGLVDLVISETRGGLTDASASTSFYINRDGSWNLDAPDSVLEAKESVTTDQLIDLDGDGKLELVHFIVPINVLELIEIFVTRAIDAQMGVYATTDTGSIGTKPIYKRKLGVGLDFDTSRPRGFLPTFDFDLNADGRRDFLGSADGERLEIHLATPDLQYDTRHARQSIPTEGQIHSGDLNADGLPDLVIFNARRLDRPLYVLTNRGVLPRTPPAGERKGLQGNR